MTMLKSQNGGIMLCCGKDKCPVLKLEGNEQISITDDDGNVVKLDVGQADLISQAIDQLKDRRTAE